MWQKASCFFHTFLLTGVECQINPSETECESVIIPLQMHNLLISSHTYHRTHPATAATKHLVAVCGCASPVAGYFPVCEERKQVHACYSCFSSAVRSCCKSSPGTNAHIHARTPTQYRLTHKLGYSSAASCHQSVLACQSPIFSLSLTIITMDSGLWHEWQRTA